MDFSYFKDTGGDWWWRIHAEDGSVVMDSRGGYSSEQECLEAIKRIKGSDNGSVLQQVDAELPASAATTKEIVTEKKTEKIETGTTESDSNNQLAAAPPASAETKEIALQKKAEDTHTKTEKTRTRAAERARNRESTVGILMSEVKDKGLNELIKETYQASLGVLTFPIPIVAAIGLAIALQQNEIELLGLKFSPTNAVVVLMFILCGLFIYCARCFRMLVVLLELSEDRYQQIFLLHKDPSILNLYSDSSPKRSKAFDYSGICALSASFAISFAIIGRLLNPEGRRSFWHFTENNQALKNFVTMKPSLAILSVILAVATVVFTTHLRNSWRLINKSDATWRNAVFYLTFLVLIIGDLFL
jgi:uncharacterized protein YegP (UPF0339 family)